MKAVTIARFGGPDVLELSEVAPPATRPGEVLVELECAGVNFIDIYMRERPVRSLAYVSDAAADDAGHGRRRRRGRAG